MGMYDTFYGKYKCPNCGHRIQFEEQTKRYECLLEEFYLGDYVDRNNRNYFYDFVDTCPVCSAENEIYLAIRRGQYVGVYVGRDASEMDITKLENITDGLARRQIYQKRCKRKLGYDNPFELDGPLDQKHVGDHITALQTDWEVIEVYHEEIDRDMLDNGAYRRAFYEEENFVYRVASGDVKRVIVIRKNHFMDEVSIKVAEDDLSSKLRSRYDDGELENRYTLQSNCKLVRIE